MNIRPPELLLSYAIMHNWFDRDNKKCIYCKGVNKHYDGCITHLATAILKKYNEEEKFNG